MKIINQSYEILSEISPGGIKELKLIELAARTCYKSEDKASEDGESAKRMIKTLIKHHHEAMLEHSSLTVKFITNRAIANEFVRHRLASFAQESTRYCNYSIEDKFDGEVTFIYPYFDPFNHYPSSDTNFKPFFDTYKFAEHAYLHLIKNGVKPEIARGVLPLDTKTELVVTANYREWRHILNLRACNATGPAHPQIQELCRMVLLELQETIPVVFDDLGLEVNYTNG